MEKSYILAVDLGTSGCKTALVGLDGHVEAWEFRPVELLLYPNGGAEQRPGDWWAALCATTRALLVANPGMQERIAAICCSTQGEGTVPVDAQGHPLMNAVLWMDARGATLLRERLGARLNISGYHPLKLLRYLQLTGGAPSLTGKDPAGHMLYIRHERPEVYRETHKFLNVLDYLNFRLTGRFSATFDSILTSWVTDNRQPSRLTYHPSLLRLGGIDGTKLPEIVPCTERLGSLTRKAAGDLGLPADTLVVAGAIDTTAAAIGSGAVEDYQAHLYIGTSSWLAAHVPYKKTDIFSSIASVPCAVPGRYLMIALQATAGGNLTFLRDKVLYHKDELLREEELPDVYKIMDRIVERTPPGSNGVLYTPWIYGERSPVEDHQLRASLFNLSLENSREDIIRAVYEGIAYNTRWLLGPVERFMNRTIEAINIVGGGAASDVWCQIFADVIDRPIRQLKDPIQANVRGAAFIAGVALGRFQFREVSRLVEYKAEFLPQAATRSVYAKGYDAFRMFHKQTRRIHGILRQR